MDVLDADSHPGEVQRKGVCTVFGCGVVPGPAVQSLSMASLHRRCLTNHMGIMWCMHTEPTNAGKSFSKYSE
eukprot:CAMPEP_0117650598 /NCGR_PEP_ID=MMETSP0804-20121206/1624_1 /TAXON_ID=1074897 /ORGANISM="Tetraselmis astigmatica, Strain CCMP880" /LENGTH=71 /DNA_ID=CAMNT_0005456479 /DNA_START=224 /DNA_END=436 /DNA_ORIENTATION=+